MAEMAVGQHALIEGEGGVKRSLAARLDARQKANWRAADMGESWLRRTFSGSGLAFHTSVEHAPLKELNAGNITLNVYYERDETHPLFSITESADEFVSEATFAKISLVAL